jgi:hypothetical protein
MEQKAAIMNPGNLIAATEKAKLRVQAWLDLANDVQSDARHAERIKRHECKACFYAGRMGGGAMTHRPCMSCGENQLYASTATDVLCMACAQTHMLCKHCGGDLDMRVRRKAWPEPQSVD